jgi:DNA-binding MarR family transcriptional regulator
LLPEASYHLRVANIEPLNPTEDAFWRALTRIVLSLPRQLHTEMLRSTRLTASEYRLIKNLSKAPNRQLRIADLANAALLSASRTTRLVEGLESRGLVAKRSNSSDARSNIAELTAQGLSTAKSANAAHLESARSRVFDNIDPKALAERAQALSSVAARLEDGRAGAA